MDLLDPAESVKKKKQTQKALLLISCVPPLSSHSLVLSKHPVQLQLVEQKEKQVVDDSSAFAVVQPRETPEPAVPVGLQPAFLPRIS